MAQDVAAEPGVAVRAFGDRLADAVERKRSQLLVGLDPRLDLLPVELRGDVHLGPVHSAQAVERFCRGIVDAVAPYAVGVKPQLAFFEALGAEGVRALEEVCAYARAAGLLVVADGKRGDIGSTARAYASAYLEGAAQPPGREGGPVEGIWGSREAAERPGREGGPVEGVWGSREVPAALIGRRAPLADALTVNPYLGRDSLDPFLAVCRRDGAGIFCLVKTSNAGGADIQDLVLRDERPLWHHVARLVAALGEEFVGARGLSSVGAIVGATHPRAVGEARRLCPQAILLLPGVGAQGATPGEVARAFTSGPASALVAASRSVIYAGRHSDLDWRSAAAAEAARLRAEIWAASGW